jgi:hypothetical protein
MPYRWDWDKASVGLQYILTHFYPSAAQVHSLIDSVPGRVCSLVPCPART